MATKSTTTIVRTIIGLLFILAGINHFWHPKFYVDMMPPYLPYHLELVYISGVFEALGGLGLFIPQVRKFAAYGLIALLVAVFPANIQMLINYFHSEGWSLFTGILIIRLPLQALFIYWVYKYTSQ